MEDLKDKVKLMLKGKSYEISFPNVGQFRQIESMKSVLSNGTYGLLSSQTNNGNSDTALNMVDVEAYLTVLCPELIKDLKVSFSELGYADYLEIEKAYRSQFLPWYNDWMKKFRNAE